MIGHHIAYLTIIAGLLISIWLERDHRSHEYMAYSACVEVAKERDALRAMFKPHDRPGQQDDVIAKSYPKERMIAKGD